MTKNTIKNLYKKYNFSWSYQFTTLNFEGCFNLNPKTNYYISLNLELS